MLDDKRWDVTHNPLKETLSLPKWLQDAHGVIAPRATLNRQRNRWGGKDTELETFITKRCQMCAVSAVSW